MNLDLEGPLSPLQFQTHFNCLGPLPTFRLFVLQNYSQHTNLVVQHTHFTLLSYEAIFDQFHRLYNKKILRLKNWRKSQLNLLVNLTSHLAFKLNKKHIFQLSDENWKSISQCLMERSWQSCKLKLLSYMNSKLLQNKWTYQQNTILKEIVKEPENQDWVSVSIKLFQINSSSDKIYRSARQCKDNYINYLDPRLNKGRWTQQEDKKLVEYYQTYGLIDKNLTLLMRDRSIIDMKNRINVILKKQKKKGQQKQNETRRFGFVEVTLIVSPNYQ